MQELNDFFSLPHPKGYVCYRTDEPLSLNGRLDDAPWRLAPWTDDFIDIRGDAGPKPRFRTRAKMLWDDEYFYVGAEMEEPHVWGTLTEHDSVIFQDNDFEVFIDPDGDNHDYYEFEINALNTGWDLLLKKPYRDGGPALNEWEIPGLKTAAHIDGTLNDPSDTDRGWTVEIAFPWAVLGEYARRPSPPHDGDQWRVNFSRVEWETDIVGGGYRKRPGLPEDNWVWSPQGVIDMHRPERWGFVQFSATPAGTGEVPFRPDPAQRVRTLLMAIYYAQREYQAENGAWAERLESLPFRPHPLLEMASLRLTREGYIATLEFRVESGPLEKWHISQDSRIWSD